MSRRTDTILMGARYRRRRRWRLWHRLGRTRVAGRVARADVCLIETLNRRETTRRGSFPARALARASRPLPASDARPRVWPTAVASSGRARRIPAPLVRRGAQVSRSRASILRRAPICSRAPRPEDAAAADGGAIASSERPAPPTARVRGARIICGGAQDSAPMIH